MSIDQSKMDLSSVLRVLRNISADQRAINRSNTRELTRASAFGGRSARSGTRPSFSVVRHQTALSAKARAIRALRAEAAQAFPDGLICDPGLDVLLDLFIAGEEGNRRVVSDLLRTEVPATTGLRWLKRLEDEGFVKRQPDPHDRRRYFITLSEESRSKVRNLIERSRLQLAEFD